MEVVPLAHMEDNLRVYVNGVLDSLDQAVDKIFNNTSLYNTSYWNTFIYTLLLVMLFLLFFYFIHDLNFASENLFFYISYHYYIC